MYIQILISGKAVILSNSVFEDFKYVRNSRQKNIRGLEDILKLT